MEWAILALITLATIAGAIAFGRRDARHEAQLKWEREQHENRERLQVIKDGIYNRTVTGKPSDRVRQRRNRYRPE